jgi:hypothetical protein
LQAARSPATPAALQHSRLHRGRLRNSILEIGEDCEGAALGCTACELFTCAWRGRIRCGCHGLPTPIIDSGTITSTIAVPGTVTAIGVQVNVTHGFDGDVDMFITPPGIAQLELSTDNGSFDDNYTNTVFVTNPAAPLITTGVAPFTGVSARGQPGASLAPPPTALDPDDHRRRSHHRRHAQRLARVGCMQPDRSAAAGCCATLPVQ